MSKIRILLTGFIAVSLGDLISIALHSPAHFILKPAILLLLIGWYWSSTHPRNSTLMRALFFCWLGDSLLLFSQQNELYFMLGLVAFLVGHLFYILTFRQMVTQAQSSLLPTQRVRYAFPIFLAGTGLIVVLYPGLGALRFPVILYATVLMIMVSTALFRLGRTNPVSFAWVFTGAICFMISDSLLALNKFHHTFAFAEVSTMATYIVAQYSIVRGLLAHPPNTN